MRVQNQTALVLDTRAYAFRKAVGGPLCVGEAAGQKPGPLGRECLKRYKEENQGGRHLKPSLFTDVCPYTEDRVPISLLGKVLAIPLARRPHPAALPIARDRC